MGMVPDNIQVPTTMPTAIKIRMAGIAFAIFSETPSIISSQVSPTRHAIKAAMEEDMIRRVSIGAP